MKYFTHKKIFIKEGEGGEPIFATAFGIKGDEFGFVGDASKIPEGADVVALTGECIIPSLIDSHTHPDYVADNMDRLICLPPSISSIKDIIEGLKSHKNIGKKNDKGEWMWVEGFGYDEAVLEEKRAPNVKDLDEVSTTQPILVYHSSGHILASNSAALNLAGVNEHTKDPEGGKIGRFSDGKPNGILYEPGAMELLKSKSPKPNFDDLVDKLVLLGKKYARLGIGELSDMYCFTTPYDRYEMYQAAVKKGFKQGITLYYLFDDLKKHGITKIPTEKKVGQVKIGGIKLFIDGTISGKTAYMLKNYPGEDHRGMKLLDEETIKEAVSYARRNGVQIAIHCMGDASLQFLIDNLKDVEPWMEDIATIRIEHASLISNEQLKMMQECKMTFALAPQVLFLFAEYEAYFKALDSKQLARAYAVNSYNKYLLTSLSSDAPATLWAEPENLFYSMRGAISRVSANGKDMNEDEKVSPAKAVTMHTINGALICNRKNYGLIQPGFRADFVALDTDIFNPKTKEAYKIGEAKSLLTYIAGIEAFKA